MNTAEVSDYLNGPFSNIAGWCGPHLWHSIQPLAHLIEAAGASGPVAEIGVYHGKFFIGLVKTMGWKQHNTAIDVFDLQEFNLDKAGEGSKERLLSNLKSSNVDLDAVNLVRADSMRLSRDDASKLKAETGGFAMFSVDGCHLPEHTVNDMLFAMEVTKPEGIIFIDDYYNVNWPGVQEGVAKFYFHNSAKFIPLLYSCNKLFLCNISYHDKYLNEVTRFVRENFKTTKMKRVKRFGFEGVNVLPDLKQLNYIAE